MKSFIALLITCALFAGCGSESSNSSYSSDSTPPKTSIKRPPKFCTDTETAKIVAEGKQLFKENCVRCHSTKLERDMTGPALLNVSERIEDAGIEQKLFYDWMRHSQKFMAEDEYFVKLYDKWNKITMDPFPHLSDADLDKIMEFVDCYSKNYEAGRTMP